MKTTHKIYFNNSSSMSEIKSESVDLIITSPPYPMIAMWDDLFSSLNDNIKQALIYGNGKQAFELMHNELNKVWLEAQRVLKVGGIACINIGDSTRRINDVFQLFSNHTKIVEFFLENEYIALSYIIWRKPSNSPTKFMGSGMLPPNAYITLEHEYILIFRKGTSRREFISKSQNRYNSAYFWEERNRWFSDIWNDVKGVSQLLFKNKSGYNRIRSAAFPLILPYRLINMFSTYNDTILDPFWGTGTTSLAAIILARNSIGYEIDSGLLNDFMNRLSQIKDTSFNITLGRIQKHFAYLREYREAQKDLKYRAHYYDFQVITKQEKDIIFYLVQDLYDAGNKITINYKRLKLI